MEIPHNATLKHCIKHCTMMPVLYMYYMYDDAVLHVLYVCRPTCASNEKTSIQHHFKHLPKVLQHLKVQTLNMAPINPL